MPVGLADSLPSTLEDTFMRTRAGIRRSAELYINVCNIMDRLVKRAEGVAADHARIALSLAALVEISGETYSTDTNDVPLLNDGLTAMSKHLQTCQALMEDESKGWEEGVLEDLKRQRDSLVSVREMFDRRERLDKDNIPHLEKRIQANENKLQNLRAKPEGVVKAGEIERIAENIIKVSPFLSMPSSPMLTVIRTSNPLSINITAPSLSRTASATNSSSSKKRFTTLVDGIKTGQASASSTQRCWPITGDDSWMNLRVCHWAMIRVRQSAFK